MATFSKQVRQLREDCILDAAARLVAQRGWGTATVDDVAAEAGIGKGTVYLHFPSKGALLAALVDRADRAVAHLIRDEATREGDAPDKLRAIFLCLGDTGIANPSLAPLVSAWLQLHCGPACANQCGGADDSIAEVVAHAQATGTLRSDISPAIVAVALRAFAGALAHATDAGLGQPPANDLWSLFTHGVAAVRTPE